MKSITKSILIFFVLSIIFLSGCSLNNRELIISQEQQDTYFPVKYLVSDFQKVGQSFFIDEDTKLEKIFLFVHYTVGEKATLKFYELDNRTNNPEEGTLLHEQDIDFFDAPIVDFMEIRLFEPLELKKDTYYSFVISNSNKNNEIGIGKISYKNVFDNGRAWYFTRKIGGNGKIIDSNFSWDQRNDDLTFKLALLK